MYSGRYGEEAAGLLTPSSAQHSERGPAAHSARLWLRERTQPRWLSVMGWLSAGWGAVAVVALAVTDRKVVLVWWVLGVLFLLVVVIVAWTEQAVDANTDGGNAGEPRGVVAPSPWGDGDGIDWEARERELARSCGSDLGYTTSAARRASSRGTCDAMTGGSSSTARNPMVGC